MHKKHRTMLLIVLAVMFVSFGLQEILVCERVHSKTLTDTTDNIDVTVITDSFHQGKNERFYNDQKQILNSWHSKGRVYFAKSITYDLNETLYSSTYTDLGRNSLISDERCMTSLDEDGNYTPHSPIYIRRDDDFNEIHGVVGGNGSVNNPYIIEGWEIHGREYGIRVENTMAHFIIRNCKLISDEYAIYLYYVQFGNLAHVICDGGYYGIYIYRSFNITVQYAKSTGGFGLNLQRCKYCNVFDCDLSSTSNYLCALQVGDSFFNVFSGLTIHDSYVGFAIFDSSYNTIKNCLVFFNEEGLSLAWAPNQIFRNNSFFNNTYNFGIQGDHKEDYYQDVDMSNVIDGKPIVFLYNKSNLEFNSTHNIGFLGLFNCSNITIKKVLMKNVDNGLLLVETRHSTIDSCIFSNTIWGISMFTSSYNTISNCTLAGENALYGMEILGNSSTNLIKNCDFDGSVFLDGSPYNILRNTSITSEYQNFFIMGDTISDFYQDIDTSNTINGNPIYYIVGKDELSISRINLGFLGLVNCKKVTIQDFDMRYSGQGILLVNSSANINRCTLSYNYWGIHMFRCSHVKISHCDIRYNAEGIWLDHSSLNTIRWCDLSNNWWSGFSIYSSPNNTIERCHVADCGMDGFLIFDSCKNDIQYCNIYGNGNGMSSHNSTVYATYNWWGSDSGPSGMGSGDGDPVFFSDGNVVYEPWLKHRVLPRTIKMNIRTLTPLLERLMDYLK